MSAALGVAKEVPSIKNPNNFYGFLSAGLGFVLLVYLAVWGYGNLLPGTLATVNLLNSYGASYLVPLNAVFLTISWTVWLYGAKLCLASLWLGGKCLVDFAIPSGAPENLQPADVIDNLLDNGRIISFVNPSSMLVKASNMFSSKFRFLTGVPSVHVEHTVKTVPGNLMLLVLLSIPAGFTGLMQRSVNAPIEYPLPVTLITIVLIIVLTKIAVCFLFNPVNPQVVTKKSDLHVAEAGNPKNFYNHVTQVLGAYKSGEAPNREYRNIHPNMVNVTDRLTSVVSGDVVVETQPQPLERSPGLAPYVLSSVGALLCLVGVVVLLNVCGQGLALHRERAYTTLLWLPRFLLAGLAARLALKAGGTFMLRSFRIFNLFYFSSHIYRIKLDGTFTASHIGIVPGSKHGGLESNRVSVQSDCYVHLHGCQVLSESTGLAGVMGMRGERIIVSAPESPELQARLDSLAAGIAAFKDSSSHLAPVKLDRNMADLININAQISAAQAGAERVGQISAQRAAAAGTPPPLPTFQVPGPSQGMSSALPHDKIRCPTCGVESPMGKKFCAECGAELKE